MEFKGSKGKWSITDGCPNGIDKLKGHIRIQQQVDLMWDICAVFTDIADNTEAKANALLISKAPEMLEMLGTLRNDYGNYIQNILQESHRMNRIKELDQLIKEATTI